MSNNHSNKIIVASAGSRKTTYIVQKALSEKDKKILILTYTIDNIKQIRSYIIRQVGFIPTNITIQSWFSFLFQECIRPYQNFIYDKRISAPLFVQGISTIGINKTNIRYFITKNNFIYSDKISELACEINYISKNKVISRIENIYSNIFIDEVQDVSGYDFDLIELLLNSKICCHFVGDCRQATYFTTCSPKYKKFKGKNIINLFSHWEKKGLCTIEEKNDCYRSNQLICDFADKLYPNLKNSISFNKEQTGHDGLFLVKTEHVLPYVEKYNPVILRWDKNSHTLDLEAKNFGTTKGQTFERVLIFPTNVFNIYLSDGNLTKVVRKKNKTTRKVKEEIKDAFHLAKYYVAITRARTSVAFVYDGESIFNELKKYEPL